MAVVNPTISITTLNVYKLKSSQKSEISRLEKETKSNYILYIGDIFQVQRHKQIENKRMGKGIARKQQPQRSWYFSS